MNRAESCMFRTFLAGCVGMVWAVSAEDASVFYLAPGQSQEVGNVTVAFTNVVVDGALTLKSGAAVTVNETGLSKVASTNGMVASVTLESGSSMTVVGSGTSDTTPETHNVVVGFLGGTGTLTIASGATMTVQKSRFWLGGNADAASRDKQSYGTLNIAGTLIVPNLECTPYYPAIASPYEPSTYPVGAVINLEDGGLLQAYMLQRNDAGMTLFNFNGGTLKAVGNNSTFINGGGAMQITITDGKTSTFDTDGHDVAIGPLDAARASLLALTGTGTFVKAGMESSS